MQSLVDAAPRAFERIELPHGFPENVISRMSDGVRKQSQAFFNSLRLQAGR
jgi:hypothetical protein